MTDRNTNTSAQLPHPPTTRHRLLTGSSWLQTNSHVHVPTLCDRYRLLKTPTISSLQHLVIQLKLCSVVSYNSVPRSLHTHTHTQRERCHTVRYYYYSRFNSLRHGSILLAWRAVRPVGTVSSRNFKPTESNRGNKPASDDATPS